MKRWAPVGVGLVGLAILATFAVRNLRGPIEADLVLRAKTALHGVAGLEGLQVTAEGCDLTVRGVISSAPLRDRALGAIRAVRGVHAVADGLSVVEPTTGPAPTPEPAPELVPGDVGVRVIRADNGDITFFGKAPNEAARNAWIALAKRVSADHQVVDRMTVGNEADARSMAASVVAALRYLPSLERGAIEASLSHISVVGFTDRVGRDEQLRGSIQRQADPDFKIDVHLALPGQRLDVDHGDAPAPDPTGDADADTNEPTSEVTP